MASNLNILKLVQAAAVVLKSDPHGRLPYIRLLKLLYIVDREAMRETGRPVTYDRAVAMEHGPVLSSTYDFIKGEHIEADEWEQFIRTDGFTAELVKSPGTAELSRWEICKIHQVVTHYLGVDHWDIVKETHLFPEWLSHQPDQNHLSVPIPRVDILAAVGHGAEAAEVEEEIIERTELARMLARLDQ